MLYTILPHLHMQWTTSCVQTAWPVVPHTCTTCVLFRLLHEKNMCITHVSASCITSVFLHTPAVHV